MVQKSQTTTLDVLNLILVLVNKPVNWFAGFLRIVSILVIFIVNPWLAKTSCKLTFVQKCWTCWTATAFWKHLSHPWFCLKDSRPMESWIFTGPLNTWTHSKNQWFMDVSAASTHKFWTFWTRWYLVGVLLRPQGDPVEVSGSVELRGNLVTCGEKSETCRNYVPFEMIWPEQKHLYGGKWWWWSWWWWDEPT